eukprot:scaffold17443_cov38-Cyclotella_meneghiniana.AAC.4
MLPRRWHGSAYSYRISHCISHRISYRISHRISHRIGHCISSLSSELSFTNSLQLTSFPSGDENSVELDVRTSKANDAGSSLGRESSKSLSSFLQSIDKLGMKLKPLAAAAHIKANDMRSSNVNEAAT